jgi:hypothetical protein
MKDFQLVEDLRQRHLVNWAKAAKKLQPEDWESQSDLPMMVYVDVFVRAAIRSGWVDGLAEEDVEEMTYQEVYNLLFIPMQTFMTKATTLEKN